MDIAILIESFAVIIIGGVGSIPGALVAAIVVGIVQSLGILWLPSSASLLVFALMAVVLVVRPQGLFGRPDLILK
jgi:branched-chain amino acid transport system permease protein